MRRNLIKTTIVCLSFLTLLSASAIAQPPNDPPQVLGATIPGIDIIVKKKPGGIVAGSTTTDSSGNFSFTLPPGEYTLQIGPAGNSATSKQSIKDSMGGGAATGQATKKGVEKWIEIMGSPYKILLNGAELAPEDASKLTSVGKTKYNEKTNVSSRVNSGVFEVSMAIKDKGVNRGAAVKVSGTLARAN